MNNISSSMIEDLTKQVGKFSNSISNDIKTNGLVSDAYRQNAAQTKEMSDLQKQLSASIQQTAKSAVGFAKQLQNGNGSFQPLTQVVSMATKAIGGLLGMLPVVGNALKGLAEGIGDVGNMMIETYDKTYASFEKISDSGVVASFDSLKSNAGAMKMAMSSVSTVIEKRSKDLAFFGGSALKGNKMITQLNSSSQNLRNDFQKLGVSSTDFLDYQISYMTQQSLLNNRQNRTTDQLIQGSEDYVKELDSIAKLTGQSRKEIQANREARLMDVQLLAGMKQYAPKAQSQFNGLLDELTTTMSKEMSTAIGGLVVSGGKVTSEMQKILVAEAPELISIAQNANQDLKNGTLDKQQYLKIMRDLAVKVEARMRPYATQLGDTVSQTKNYVHWQKASLAIGVDEANRDKKLADLQNQTLKDNKSSNSNLAGAKQSMESVQANIEQLATNSTLVSGLMRKMGEGLEAITEKFYKLTKTEMPAHLKAASEARKATDAEAKLKNEISKNEKILANKEASINDKNTAARDLIGLRGKLIAATKKKEAAIAKKERADIEAGIAVGGATTTDTSDAASSTPSAPAPTSGEPIPDAPVNNDPIDATGPRNSNSSGKERGVLPEVLAKLNQVSSRVGKKLVVTSGYRPGVPNHGERKAVDLGFGPNKLSQEEINKVFTAAIDVGFTGIGAEFRARGGAHIHLDTSHPTLVGWGSDTRSSSTRQDSPFLANLIEQRRSGRPAAPNQNSARTGGIFSGPDSGYLTQLHGDEIVAPVGKQALNTSMIGGLTNNEASDAEFSSVYNELEDKLDRLITIMGDTAKATKKQSMAKFV